MQLPLLLLDNKCILPLSVHLLYHLFYICVIKILSNILLPHLYWPVLLLI